MQSLHMRKKLADDESRVLQLVADFYKILEVQEMPTYYESESKKCIKYLIQAVRPVALRQIVEKELAKEGNRHLRKEWRTFILWLTRQADDFVKYEAWLAPGPPKPDAPNRPTNPSSAEKRRPPRPGADKTGAEKPKGPRTTPSAAGAAGAAAVKACL